MTNPIFRPATNTDLPAIVALLADDALGQAREDPGPILNPRYQAAFAAIARDPNQLLAVVEEDGAVIGCLQLSFIPGLSRLGMWRGQIESVRIAAARRGGAGSAAVCSPGPSQNVASAVAALCNSPPTRPAPMLTASMNRSASSPAMMA